MKNTTNKSDCHSITIIIASQTCKLRRGRKNFINLLSNQNGGPSQLQPNSSHLKSKEKVQTQCRAHPDEENLDILDTASTAFQKVLLIQILQPFNVSDNQHLINKSKLNFLHMRNQKDQKQMSTMRNSFAVQLSFSSFAVWAEGSLTGKNKHSLSLILK